MLKLSRNEGESITLILANGDTVEITLTEYRGKRTIVTIDAPKDVAILRNELLPKNALERSNQEQPVCHDKELLIQSTS